MKSPGLACGILATVFCGACSMTPVASHGPVSERLLRRLDADAITRAMVLERVQSGQMRVSLAAPEERAVTLPFSLNDGTPHVQVGVNGRPVTMVLDTGAVKTLIQASVAAERKVTMLTEREATVSMRGVIGIEKARVGILEPLQIGPWQLYAYPCIVRTHENTVRGLFGDMNWSSNLLGFDVAAKLATYLTLDYRTRQATYGFHQMFPRPQGKRVASAPLKMSGGAPFITLKSGGHSWDALVDTGSFNGIEISQQLAERLRVGQGEAVRGLYLMSVGGSTTSAAAGLRTVTLPAIAMFGETFPQAQVDVSPGPPRVGSFFFKDYRVTFDFKRRLVWLEW
ncbi:MAG TPA: retroviral-like aspartic protease family protein [Prosthecobacter sp.]|nr:retroviral-like aspartic protease family protein [Prosthecobacter sp.]